MMANYQKKNITNLKFVHALLEMNKFLYEVTSISHYKNKIHTNLTSLKFIALKNKDFDTAKRISKEIIREHSISLKEKVGLISISIFPFFYYCYYHLFQKK